MDSTVLDCVFTSRIGGFRGVVTRPKLRGENLRVIIFAIILLLHKLARDGPAGPGAGHINACMLTCTYMPCWVTRLAIDMWEWQLAKGIALKSMATDIWNQRLDAGNDEVPRHAGQIADGMHEWEGPLSERLGLTDTDVAEIKTEHPKKLKLQS